MQTKFKKLFRVLFFLISALVFLFVFFPEKCLARKNQRTDAIGQNTRQSILRKRVYYTKGSDEEIVE